MLGVRFRADRPFCQESKIDRARPEEKAGALLDKKIDVEREPPGVIRG